MSGSLRRSTGTHRRIRGGQARAAAPVPITWLDWWSRIVKTPADLRHVAISVGLLVAVALSPVLLVLAIGVSIAGDQPSLHGRRLVLAD